MKLNIKTLFGESRETEENPPIVLLHGWGQSISNLIYLGKLLGSFLGKRRRVFLVDLPGHGKSPMPEKVFSAWDCAEVLAQNLSALNVKGKISLFGHSFGGKVAMSYTHLYPNRVQDLCLCASSGLLTKKNLWKKLRILGIKMSAKAIKLVDKIFRTKFFEKKFIPKFGSRDYKQAKNPILRGMLVRSVNEDFSTFIKGIKTKTLLLWGEEDGETPLLQAKKMLESMQNAKLISFEKKGHYLFSSVGAHLVAQKYLSFLRESK